MLHSSTGENMINLTFFVVGMPMLQVIVVLMISGCAAATAIGYVGKYGEEKMGWIALCDHVSKFCNRTLVSLLLSYVAFFCYMGLTIMTACKLTSPAHK